MIVAGDTRFDRVGSIAASAETDPELASMVRGTGSSWPEAPWPEDEQILYRQWLTIYYQMSRS